MNCGRVSNQLSAYMDRELTGIEMLQIRAHLDTCDQCRAEHEALARMKVMLGRLRTVDPPRELVSQTVRRFEASGAWAGSPRAADLPRWSLESRGGPGRTAGPLLTSPVHACLNRVHRAASRRLGLIPWQPLSLGLTTAVLALALIFTNLVRHRQADALVASTPSVVRQGKDPMGTDWPPGDYPPYSESRGQILGGHPSLRWVNVSLEGGASWPSR